MANHPTRARRAAAPPGHPTPDAIRQARELAGLSEQEAAALIYGSKSGWIKWERGERKMHPGLWELFLIKAREAA